MCTMKSESAFSLPTWKKHEIEEAVTFARLELYNRGVPCGPQAIHKRLKEHHIHPVPSTTTISRILKRYGLTHGRTGFYAEDES